MVLQGSKSRKKAVLSGDVSELGDVFFWNLLESTPSRIPLIKSSHKWTRMLFII